MRKTITHGALRRNRRGDMFCTVIPATENNGFSVDSHFAGAYFVLFPVDIYLGARYDSSFAGSGFPCHRTVEGKEHQRRNFSIGCNYYEREFVSDALLRSPHSNSPIPFFLLVGLPAPPWKPLFHSGPVAFAKPRQGVNLQRLKLDGYVLTKTHYFMRPPDRMLESLGLIR